MFQPAWPFLLYSAVLWSCTGAVEDAPLPIMEEPAAPVIVHPPQGTTQPDGTYHSPAGRFFILFPEEPDYSRETSKSGVVTHLYVARYSDALAGMVSYADHPHELVATVKPEELLAQAAAGAARPFGIAVEEAMEPLSINGHPGASFVGEGQGMFLQALFLLVGDRLYQVTLLGMGVHAPSAVAEAFFASFHLEEAPGEPLEEWFPRDLLDRMNTLEQ